MKRMHTGLIAAALSALFAVGCAQSNGDISYVQPNYVKKKDLLDGTWYIRNTVTRTPATTGFTFTGETGDLEKIVFEIQEDTLVGYRAYAQIPGQDQEIDDASKPSGTTTTYCETDSAGKRTCVGGHRYYGAPVVTYPIQKHFDIQRGYNPATGETTNVINENASDRPWNEREYIRVAWENQGMGWTLGTFGMLNPKGSSDVSAMIYANEPGTDPYDWPRQEFEDKNGEQKLKYFEFTTRHMAQPDEYYFEDYGISVPLCYFSPGYDCAPAQVEVRTSIAKIDPNETLDYEPLVYDNSMMSKFGYFRTERLNYDRRFGHIESDILYLANRHRIWKSAFERDGQGNVDWSKPIPFAQRTVKPVVYYVTPAHRMGGQKEYDKYWETAKILEKNWDRAFRRAVAAAQGKGDDISGVPQMLYVCPNPVPADASADVIANCGPVGFEARFGDLRRSFLSTIAEAVPNGLLGYGPSSADPETGEIISANANTYSAGVERYAQYTLDIVNAVSGTYTLDEVVRGDDVKNYMLSHPTYAGVLGVKGPIKSELQGDAVQKSSDPSLGAFERPTMKTISLMTSLKQSGGLPVAGSDRARAAMEMLKQNPALESAILDNPELAPDMMTALPAAVRKVAEQDPVVKRNALRTALLKLPDLMKLEKMKKDHFARKNICFTADDYEDRPTMAVAFREAQNRRNRITQLVAAGTPPAEAFQIADDELRARFHQNAWRSTAEHEFGHTVGLRHNFQGSFDAVNYHDTYWDLKEQTLTVLQNGNPVIPRTPGDLKAASDGTEDQLLGTVLPNGKFTGSLMEYEYSSIMDYSGKEVAAWQGIGKYDEAAILFAYSGGTQPGYVEVFSAPLRSSPLQFDGSDGKKVTVNGAGYDLPVVNALRVNTAVPNYTERFHYSTVPLRFGTGGNIEDVISSGISNLRQRRVEKWETVAKKNEELRQLLASKPNPTPADIEALDAPAEVPYMFCTDDHVGYVLSCNRFDRGPDYYEMNRQWLEDYWNSYFFNHFRRDRYFFSSDSALFSAYGTFLDTGLVYKHWVHAMYGSRGANAQKIPNYVGSAFGYDATTQDYWTMATFDGINNLIKVMSVPPAGFYMLYTPDLIDVYTPNVDGRQYWTVITEGFDYDHLTPEGQLAYEDYYRGIYGSDVTAFVNVPRGMARRMYSRYDPKAGFNLYDKLTEVGHYNDQIGALFAAIDAQAYFLGVDDYADQNRFAIPYYLTFREEMNKVFSSIWAVDEDVVSPTLYLSVDDKGQFTRPNILFPNQVSASTYVAGFDYPKAFTLDPNQHKLATNMNHQTTYTARIYSLLLGMAAFSVNFDLDYAKQNQIIRLGGADDLQVPSGWEKFEVQDFTTGARYAALQKVGSTQDTAAVKMVKEARKYQDVINNPCLVLLRPEDCGTPLIYEQTRAEYTEIFRDQIRDLEYMRGMFELYGKAF